MTVPATSGSSSSPAVSGEPLEALARLLEGRRTLVLSGAGISTESGIPDYRSPERLARPHKPMMFRQFVDSHEARKRYWARSYVGWQALSPALPNAGHAALVRLEESGWTAGLITQNVDGLHQKAGSKEVIELHGSLASVRCLECKGQSSRQEMQVRLAEANPQLQSTPVEMAPDGDAFLPDELVGAVRIPGCNECGGILKPDVVFFGENVPKERVAQCERLLLGANALLVVGSSLTVMSGLRWVLAAQRLAMPVAIVNDGATRADGAGVLKVEGRLGKVLPALAARLATRPVTPN